MSRNNIYIVTFAIFVLESVAPICSQDTRTLDPFQETLLQLVIQDQAKTEQPMRWLQQWHHMKGGFSASIKVNFYGGFEKTLARRLLSIHDNSFIFTAFVVSNLLNAMKYGNIPKPSDDTLTLAVDFMHNFHERNVEYNNSLIKIWPQVYNSTHRYWVCEVDNMKAFSQIVNEIPKATLFSLLQVYGLGGLTQEVGETLVLLDTYLQTFEYQTRVDLEDTFNNVFVGAQLHDMRDRLPDEASLWHKYNSNLTSAYDALKQVAYRPFSDDPNVNTMDPRAYFCLRKFFDQAKDKGEDIALFVIWFQSLDDLRKHHFTGAPFVADVNELDILSAANFLYGVTTSVLYGTVGTSLLADPLLAQIYLNTSSMLAFAIRSNFSGRPDLCMIYYTSKMHLFYYMARSVSALATAQENGAIPLQVMETVYDILKTVSQKEVTEMILSEGIQDGDHKVYFEDFLGNADVAQDNKPLKRGEDRIFTTSMAANALMSIWTIYDPETKTNYWRKETPPSVVTMVSGCIAWLTEHTLDGSHEPDSALFTHYDRYYWGLSYWYPANRIEYFNGTALTNTSVIPDENFILAVSGYIEPSKYDAMLEELHFGYKTPLTFEGFHTQNNPVTFPYWSSVPLTYSTVLLAVSRFSNTV